jgi:hypothetical protein
MDEATKHSALMSALTTEHFVLQTASSSTISEASARSSLYILSLSSSLVAIGFMSQSPEMLLPFVAVVLPVLLLLGMFTVVRLVDTSVENLQYLVGIARIRGYYRSLSPEAEPYFSGETGRWPEAKTVPSQSFGPFLALFGTTATMIAFVNSVVAAVSVTLSVKALKEDGSVTVAFICGGISVILLMIAFTFYQRWRFSAIGSVMLPVTSDVPSANPRDAV